MEKPPILSDEEIGQAAVKVKGLYYTGGIGYLGRLISFGKRMMQAQRDADIEWYKGERREAYDRGYDRGIREEQGVIDGIKERCAEKVEQARTGAREEVAREIFEEISALLLDDGVIVGFERAVWQSLKDKYNKQSIGR